MWNYQHVPLCICVYAQSCLTGTPWTGARQAPLSMEFPREEYWSGLLALPPGDLPLRDQTHISCVSCTGRQTFTTGATWEALMSLRSTKR